MADMEMQVLRALFERARAKNMLGNMERVGIVLRVGLAQIGTNERHKQPPPIVEKEVPPQEILPPPLPWRPRSNVARDVDIYREFNERRRSGEKVEAIYANLARDHSIGAERVRQIVKAERKKERALRDIATPPV